MHPRLACVALALVGCAAPDPAGEAATSSTTDATGTTAALPPPDGFWLPLACGTRAQVGQGNFGEFSHTGLASYAYDLLLERGTPVHAMAPGVVLHLYDETGPGDPCRDGGDERCFAFANLVVLLHGDGTTTVYKHLDAVHVARGERLERGDLLGLSGSTGWSTRPHLHVARMKDCGTSHCPSLPLRFVEAGVPETGEWVEACP